MIAATLVTSAKHETREVLPGICALEFATVDQALREAIHLTTTGPHEELYLWRPHDRRMPGAHIVRGDVRGLPRPEPAS